MIGLASAQARPTDVIRVESRAESLDVTVEVMLVENLIRSRAEQMCGPALIVILLALAIAPKVEAQVTVSRQPAVALDPITGIIDAFRTDAVVALGEGSHVCSSSTETRSDLTARVLYVASPSEITFSRINPRLCADAAYMQMRLARLALLPGPPASSAAWNTGATRPIQTGLCWSDSEVKARRD